MWLHQNDCLVLSAPSLVIKLNLPLSEQGYTIALFEFGTFFSLLCWVWRSAVSLCVTSALVGSMQTGSQRCSRSNTLASGSKHTVCLYCGQQMAMFNYFHHLSTLSLAQPPPPPCFFSIFIYFSCKSLETEIFSLARSLLTGKACITLYGSVTLKR